MRTIKYVSILIAILICFCDFKLLAQAPDRSKPPELGPPPTLHLPEIQRFQLSNGLQVLLMEKHQVPLVQINVLIKAGTAMDPANRPGLASMTVDMLDEGAGDRNALQLADAIDYLGANLSTYADFHHSVVALHTPLSKLESALPLLADVVLRPKFPPQELERLRKQRLTTLIQWHDEPRAVAQVLLNQTLFGKKHPYGWINMGDEKSLRDMKVEELQKFHRTYFHPNNAALIVVGDVTKDSIVPKLEKYFGEWKAASIPRIKWPAIKQVKRRQIYLVDKPGAAQSEIRIGRIGVSRQTPDYFAIRVMNTILGGSFTSRLNQNLREEHGYTYGAGSYFAFRPLPGPFVAYAAVQTAVTDKALMEFMKELQGILQPVTDQELERAKNYLALRFPENFQTVARIAYQLQELVLYDLPEDYFNKYVQNILAVTKAEVLRVAQKYVDPQKLAIIVVGDRKVIEPGIKVLNLGPIKHLSIEDLLGKIPELEGTQ